MPVDVLLAETFQVGAAHQITGYSYEFSIGAADGESARSAIHCAFDNVQQGLWVFLRGLVKFKDSADAAGNIGVQGRFA
jgi:hypothetical protein